MLSTVFIALSEHVNVAPQQPWSLWTPLPENLRMWPKQQSTPFARHWKQDSGVLVRNEIKCPNTFLWILQTSLGLVSYFPRWHHMSSYVMLPRDSSEKLWPRGASTNGGLQLEIDIILTIYFQLFWLFLVYVTYFKCPMYQCSICIFDVFRMFGVKFHGWFEMVLLRPENLAARKTATEHEKKATV